MKPTTETIILALRDGIALRTDLCERLQCQNAALTKVIRNMLDRDLITRDMEDGALAYYLTAKGRAWQPGMQSASVRAKAKGGEDSAAAAVQAMKIVLTPVQRNAVMDSNLFATAPELQYLAPEDYEMPPADPVLLASANRELSDQLSNAKALTDKLQALLTSKEHECEALRGQSAPVEHAGLHVVVGSIIVKPKDAAIFDESATTIYVDDEAGGPFIKIKQHLQETQEIGINPDEWPAIRAAVEKMLAVCAQLERAK